MKHEMEKQAKEDLQGLANDIRKQVTKAAALGIEVLKFNQQEAVERINQTASQKAGKIYKTVTDIQEWDDVKVVRKYWGGVKEDHFFGDQTKID